MTTDDFDDADLDLYDGELTDEGSADRTSTPNVTPSTGSTKAVKQVQRLAGRLGFGSSETNSTSAEVRLSSVVSESVEGPALELLRANPRFALPDGQSWIMLVLPTAGDFGGLNKRTKDEAKGQIIQMIFAEAMDTIVTKDLLMDDALGFVPNTKTLDRMKEFGILTEAGYTFAAVCVDELTGGPKVFAVPAMLAELGTTGKVYEATLQVSKGTADLDELISPWIVESMLAIYRDPSLGHGEGDAALDKAVQANMELTVEYATRGEWPTPAEYVQNLAEKFPSAQIEIRPGAAPRHRAPAEPEPRVDDPATEAFPAQSAEPKGQALAYSAVDEPSSDEVEQVEAVEPEEVLEPEPVDAVVEEQSAPPADDDLDFGPDFGASAPTPVSESSPEQGSGAAVMDQAALRTIIEAIESIKEDISAPVASTEGGLPVGPPPEQGTGTVIPGSEFTYEQMMDTASRRYLNGDLGLFVDDRPFRERMTWSPPTIEVPATGTTPWLGEQVEVLTSALNSQIKAKHEEAIRSLYRRYAELADASAAQVNSVFNYEQNPDSKWGRAYANLAKDKAAMVENNRAAKISMENQIREKWAQRRASAVADQVARAEQQFDHRNAARIEAEVREAEDKILNNAEALYQHDLRECNRLRAIEAREMMDQSVSNVLGLLDEQASALQTQLNEMAEEAAHSIRAYIDENRISDLDQANTNERKLAADTRLEEARAEASARVAAVAEEADKRIAAMEKDMERRTAEQQRQLQINEQTMDMTVANERARTKSLEQQLHEQKRISDETLAFQQASADQKVQIAEASARAAQNDKDTYIQGQERRSSYMLVAFFLAVIVVGAVAFLAGWAL